MTDDGLQINPDWKARIAEIGRAHFIREEMLRLGFYASSQDSIGADELRQVWSFLDHAYPRLAELRRELGAVRRHLEAFDQIEKLIAEVRRERIIRVKREREERKLRKAQHLAARRVLEARTRLKTPGFLGDGVSGRLQFEGGKPDQVAARGLPAPGNLEELAVLMKLDPSEIQWLAYDRIASTVDHYTRFEIPKRSGGFRLIAAPKPKLRIAQAWIDRNILRLLAPSAYAMAFRPSVSILDNAKAHLNSAIVVRIDLKDFFPSIRYPRVRGFFEYLGYNPGMSSVFGLLCTDAQRVKLTLDDMTRYVAVGDRALPQGAITSPALANLIASLMDGRIAGFCGGVESQWAYTRYADDLTFSSRRKDADVGGLIRTVTGIVGEEGFLVNERKTAVMRAPGRQLVTGLLIDDAARISRRDLRRFRAFLHRCDQAGLEAVSREIGKDALSVARGHLSYVSMIMPDRGTSLREEYGWL
jgi:RNA-directed DNA polymerase